MILSITIGLKLAFLYSVGASVLTNNLSNADDSFLTDILSGLVLSNPNSEYRKYWAEERRRSGQQVSHWILAAVFS